MFEEAESIHIRIEANTIFARRLGSGEPLLLLHGFPETHLMWRDAATALASHFCVVCADLPGYGQSGCPSSAPDHAPYTKRAMAADMVEAMAALGYKSFFVAGHDRGGRVAYRMALDRPQTVKAVAVLDILPASEVWDRADARFALSFWPWSLLAQPAPLPEKLLVAAPEAIVDDAINNWDTPSTSFSSAARLTYIEALKDPASAHAICEEFRAAATLDREIDAQDRREGKLITCPLLVLWSQKGALSKWYEAGGGPLAIWRTWASDVRGFPVDAGHFFPEEKPLETARALAEFFIAIGNNPY